MSPSGPFSRCVVCDRKIPHQDGHDTCLYCLGESHNSKSCPHCKAFTKAALKARQQRLKLHLWESTLSSTAPSEGEMASTSRAAPVQSVVSKVSKMSKKSAAPKSTTLASNPEAPAPAPPKAKPSKTSRAKASAKPKATSLQLSPASGSIPSPILEGLSRRFEASSEAAVPPPSRRIEPVLPAEYHPRR